MTSTQQHRPIDRGVPLPEARGLKYPFAEMLVGDSFLEEPNGKESLREVQVRVSCAARYWGKKLSRKYTTRRDGLGVRVWRVT